MMDCKCIVLCRFCWELIIYFKNTFDYPNWWITLLLTSQNSLPWHRNGSNWEQFQSLQYGNLVLSSVLMQDGTAPSGWPGDHRVNVTSGGNPATEINPQHYIHVIKCYLLPSNKASKYVNEHIPLRKIYHWSNDHVVSFCKCVYYPFKAHLE